MLNWQWKEKQECVIFILWGGQEVVSVIQWFLLFVNDDLYFVKIQVNFATMPHCAVIVHTCAKGFLIYF